MDLEFVIGPKCRPFAVSWYMRMHMHMQSNIARHPVCQKGIWCLGAGGQNQALWSEQPCAICGIYHCSGQDTCHDKAILRCHPPVRLDFSGFLGMLAEHQVVLSPPGRGWAVGKWRKSFFCVWLFLNPFVESFLVFSNPLETPLHRLSCFGTCAIQVMTAIERGKLSQLPGRHQVHCFWTDAPQESMSMRCRIRMCEMLKAGWHSTFGCGGPLLWWTPVHAFWPQLCEFDSKAKLKWSQMESLKRPGIEVIKTNSFFITDHQWWSLCTPCPTSQPLMPETWGMIMMTTMTEFPRNAGLPSLAFSIMCEAFVTVIWWWKESSAGSKLCPILPWRWQDAASSASPIHTIVQKIWSLPFVVRVEDKYVHLYPFISQDHPVSRRLDSRAAFCCVGTGAATWPLQPCTAWCQAPLLDLMLLLSALAWHWWVLGCAQISLLRYWVNHWRDLAALHEEKRCKSARELWPIGRNASPDCPQPLSKKLHCSSFWTAGSLRIVAWRCWLESAWTLACGAWKAWVWAPSCPSIDCNFRWCHRSVLSLSFFNLAPCFSLLCYDMLHCFTSRGFPNVDGRPACWQRDAGADPERWTPLLKHGRFWRASPMLLQVICQPWR